MGKKYLRRVSQLVRRMVTQLLSEESNDPRLLDVTVTDVVVNRDTTRAEVYYSVYGDNVDLTEIQNVLNGATGWLQSRMAPALRLRNMPHLVFTYDPSLAHGEKIDALLQQLQEGKNTNHDEERDDIDTSDAAPTTM